MFETVFILVVIVVLVGALVRDAVPPSVGFLAAVAVALIAGIISVEEALSGFSNPVLIIIGSLFVLARSLQRAVNTGKFLGKLMGDSSGVRKGLLRLTIPVAGVSSFLNNTPIVASLIQPMGRWADKHKLSVSYFLMPLSFATILGGTITLIGTSTNLVVSGLLTETGYGSIGFFELAKLGLPVATVGLATIILLLPKLLPARKTTSKEDTIRRSVVEFTAEGSVDGQTVAEAGLRNMNKLYLATLIRKNGETVAPVKPSTAIYSGDTLQFVGDVAHIAEQPTITGLKLKADKHRKRLGLREMTFYEVVLGHESPVINRTLKDTNFRGHYQAAVFAIHRSGESIGEKLGEVRLRVGDTLLVAADDYFLERWEDERDFLLISRFDNDRSVSRQQLGKFLGIAAFVAFLKIAFDAPLEAIFLSAAILTVMTGLLSVNEARRSVDFDLLILIGASISFAAAVLNSGLAEAVASNITALFGAWGALGLLAGIILSAFVLTELVTNTAAASLLFPIVLASAISMGLDPRIFALVLAVACSLSFLSPLGYQTNTMVFGPGGYKFTDFARVGGVMTLVTAVTLFITASFYV